VARAHRASRRRRLRGGMAAAPAAQPSPPRRGQPLEPETEGPGRAAWLSAFRSAGAVSAGKAYRWSEAAGLKSGAAGTASGCEGGDLNGTNWDGCP